MILQFRRLKKYSNDKSLIELAYLVAWEVPRGKDPISDELAGKNVTWQAMGFLVMTQDELDKLSIHWQSDQCFFTDDVK